jgi:hypothetical protein
MVLGFNGATVIAALDLRKLLNGPLNDLMPGPRDPMQVAATAYKKARAVLEVAGWH